jgi:signal transduction histidine kinase
VDRLKGEFLSTAAHELRTPMASIFGFTELLITQENDAETQKEYLGIIYRQSQRMREILDELLDLARIEARRGKDFKYSRVCGQELLAEIIRDFKCPEGRTPPQLSAPESALYVTADSGKLRQAVLNVLVNAYKFSPMGGDVGVQMELMTQDPEAPMVCIHVTDHGMGMTPAHVAQVGTRFFRADTTGTVAGSGLGMSIVKEIVSIHKGQVTVVSTMGAGTQITISLPAVASI